MGNTLKLLGQEKAIVIGVAVGTVAAPFLVSTLNKYIGGVGGKYAGAVANVAAGAIVLLLGASIKPRMAVAAASVFFAYGLIQAVPQLNLATS